VDGLLRTAFDKRFHIFTINEDGTNKTKLTTGDVFYSRPAWSPDGKKLVYCVKQTLYKNNIIWIMNSDGTGNIKLTEGEYNCYHPSWSISR